MKIFLTFLAILFLALPARAEVQSPESTIHAFYTWVLDHPATSLPSPKELEQLENSLSPELVQLLKDAASTEARCIAATPKGGKPFLLEGNLFVGNFEGASEVTFDSPKRDGENVFFEVDLIYIDTHFPKAHKKRVITWKDRLELRLVDSSWLVQDVKYQQDQSLVIWLQDYLKEGARSCGK